MGCNFFVCTGGGRLVCLTNKDASLRGHVTKSSRRRLTATDETGHHLALIKASLIN